MIVKTDCETDGALHSTRNDGSVAAGWWDGVDVCPLTGGEARPGAGPGYNECWQTVRIHFHRGTRLQQPRH